MTMNIDHPFYFLETLSSTLPSNSTFEFSVYKYKPQSILDERQFIQIESSELSSKSIERFISNLPTDNELAFHSKIRINKKVLHIPMIDFQLPEDQTLDGLEKLEKVIPKRIFNEISIFNSGRSCHAYSFSLINQKEWYEFMGRLLLATMPHEKQLIDTRWIGHRLIAGYSSLRWSNNTNQYLSAPRKVDIKRKRLIF